MGYKLQLSIMLLVLFTPYLSLSQSFAEIRKDVNQYKIYSSIEEALTNPEGVYRLNLNNSKIDEKSLEHDLPKFKNLRELQLSNTFISNIPTSIGELKNLQFLEIQHLEKQNLNLFKIPKSIQKLNEIININLIGNPNIEWEEAFFFLSKLPKLVNIALMNNNFQKLPNKITGLSSLEMIWLGKNTSLDLEDTFLKLSKLKNLSQMGLGGNGHSQLPNQIALLKNIENLWLSGNNWKDLEGLQYLPKLSQLSLHNCNLSLLPKGLIQCERLEYLSFVGNPNMLFDEVLRELPISARTLNLSNNNIQNLSIDGLKKTKLKKLILKNNKILERDIKKYKLANKNLEISYK